MKEGKRRRGRRGWGRERKGRGEGLPGRFPFGEGPDPLGGLWEGCLSVYIAV